MSPPERQRRTTQGAPLADRLSRIRGDCLGRAHLRLLS
jgi:hypothetical protein